MTKLTEILRESGPALVMVITGVFFFVLACAGRAVKKRRHRDCQLIKKIDALDEAVAKERQAINMLKLGIEQLKRRKP